ncbi:unnamed protein product [Allacma fusca]|uniref:Uncharacterized protein n=1 Tax=Allacma fusca TaxID=39272 RepID=A0A8J2NNB2_9HEXA|nr:unnamed protein product [Allacma fusca]
MLSTSGPSFAVIRLKMAPTVTSEVEDITRVLSKDKMTYRVIQDKLLKKLGTSHTTVNKIIHGDLAMETKKKHRGHTLKDSCKKYKKTNARELYERHLAVPRNVKGNSHYYVSEVLKPLLEVEVQKRYGEDTSNVYVHHDATCSHNARFTQDYARELKDRTGVTLISNSEIPVKSPDKSPVDFFGLGILKKNLFNRRASTLNGPWKVVNKGWNSIPVEKCLEVIVSWKRRLISVSKRNGEHVENTGQIHCRVLCPKI